MSIPIGSLNRVTAIIGEREMGKSSYLKIDTRAYQRETGGYVIGHSPNGQIGDAPDISFYDRLDGWRGLEAGVRRHPERIHIMTRGRVEPLIDLAEAMSLAIRRRAHRERADEIGSMVRYNETRPPLDGTRAPPILLIVDEGTAMKRHPSDLQIERLQTFLVSARHKHVGFSWSIQSPTSRQWVILEQANRFRIFRYGHQYGQTAMMAAGIPRDVAYDLADLPQFSYFRFDKGAQSVARYEILPPP